MLRSEGRPGPKLHVLIVPSELYRPPLVPLHGLFQEHHASALAGSEVQVGIASFGFVPWRFALRRFPYPKVERRDRIDILRRFDRSVLPARLVYGAFGHLLAHRTAALLQEYCRSFGTPDIVHAHNTFYAGVAAALLQRALRIPFVLTEHSSGFRARILSERGRAAAREVFDAAGAITAVSASLARHMANVGSTRHPTCPAIGNVLDPWLESRARATPAIQSRQTSGFHLLSIGALTPIKNHALLLHAFAAAFRGDNGARLRIVGEGPLRKNLEALTIQLGLQGRVELLGYLGRDRVIAEIGWADALALSSTIETFGVALIEALAFGRPILSTRCGGPEEIINEENGILTDLDAESLACGLQRLRDETFDRVAIQRRCLERYGAVGFATRLRDIYDAILTGPDRHACGE